MATQSFSEVAETQPPILPGKRLRQAREARQISIEQVAQHLHQDVSVVRALEEDNYDWLPGQTYVMGYLRAYARLVDEPVDEILASLQTSQHATTELVPDILKQNTAPPVFNALMKWVLPVTVLVLLLATAWWVIDWLPGQI